MRMGTIMGCAKAGWGARRALRWGALAAVAVGAAACSSEATRFNEGYGTPYAGGPAASQGPPGQPAPAGQVERQPLPQYQSPPPAPDVTGSVPSANGGHWDWQGGTPVVVAQGETISTLAHRYNVPTQAIMQANKITNPASIQPGQRLVIPRYVNHGGPAQLAHAALPRHPSEQPAGAAAATGPSEHVVASGETLSAIARRHRITIRELVAANNMTAETPLKIGMKLTIPARPAAVAKNAPGAPASAPGEAAGGGADEAGADAAIGETRRADRQRTHGDARGRRPSRRVRAGRHRRHAVVPLAAARPCGHQFRRQDQRRLQ